MIRRAVGDEFWLFAQNDHAILSGTLAEQFGGNGFDAPSSQTITGIAMHDAGWPLHDDEPTINNDHVPIDVFESRREVALKVWTASANRAAAVDPYAGLLVSLHSLALSIFAATQTSFKHEKVDLSDPRTRFDMNKFQHGQIELQEKLRAKLGMRTDVPLRNGLAEDSNDPREQQLVFDFRLLQAMDKVSLSVCCTHPPFPRIEPVLMKPGSEPLAIEVRRPAPDRLVLNPWPFKGDSVQVTIPFKRLPAKKYDSDAALREVYASAPRGEFSVSVTRD